MNFKEAVEKDVNEKTENMKRCRAELESALTNDEEDHISNIHVIQTLMNLSP